MHHYWIAPDSNTVSTSARSFLYKTFNNNLEKRAKYKISPQLLSLFCKVCSVLLDVEGLDEGGREVSFHSVYSDSVDGCQHVLSVVRTPYIFPRVTIQYPQSIWMSERRT